MTGSLAARLSDRMQQIDQQVLTVLNDATDEQLSWSERPTAPSIAFHIWHISRYADRNQAMLAALEGPSASTDEIWTTQNYASRWGLDVSTIGSVGTGMGMSDEDAANLTLPGKTDLLEYVEQSLRRLDEQFARLDDQTLMSDTVDSSGRSANVAAALLSHLTHASRHLGMIEALRGIQGQRGTASA